MLIAVVSGFIFAQTSRMEALLKYDEYIESGYLWVNSTSALSALQLFSLAIASIAGYMFRRMDTGSLRVPAGQSLAVTIATLFGVTQVLTSWIMTYFVESYLFTQTGLGSNVESVNNFCNPACSVMLSLLILTVIKSSSISGLKQENAHQNEYV